MQLKLGVTYVTGGPLDQHTVTLPFWNADSRGEAYRYVHIPLKPDTSDTEVIAILQRAIAEVNNLSGRRPFDPMGEVTYAAGGS